jgi:hypothetical protein
MTRGVIHRRADVRPLRNQPVYALLLFYVLAQSEKNTLRSNRRSSSHSLAIAAPGQLADHYGSPTVTVGN